MRLSEVSEPNWAWSGGRVTATRAQNRALRVAASSVTADPHDQSALRDLEAAFKAIWGAQHNAYCDDVPKFDFKKGELVKMADAIEAGKDLMLDSVSPDAERVKLPSDRVPWLDTVDHIFTYDRPMQSWSQVHLYATKEPIR